jgi:hypothetical protein
MYNQAIHLQLPKLKKLERIAYTCGTGRPLVGPMVLVHHVA